MNRKKFITITMTVIMFLLAGCTNEQTLEMEETVKTSEEQKSNTGDILETKEDMKNKSIQLRVLTDGNTDGCSNENGYYYINKTDNTELKNGNYAYHLMYMDYAAKKEVYLCSNAGCKHNTEDCTSVISGEMEEPIIFWYNDYLYLLDRAYDNEGTTSSGYSIGEDGETEWGVDLGTQEYPTALYRMNPDGSDRKKVHDFKTKISLESYVMSDGTNLYFIEKALKNEKTDRELSYSTVAEKKLIKVDLDTGEEQEVCDLNIGEKTNDVWRVLGCYGSSIVMQGMIYDHELTDEERVKDMNDKDFSRSLTENTETEIGVIDINSGKYKKIYSTSNKTACGYAQVDKYLYISTDENSKIRKIDLDTGKESVLTKLKENCITYHYDDVLYCTGWESNDTYFIDLKTGEAKKFLLRTKTAGFSPQIMAETENMYLVVYDYEATRDAADEDVWNITKNKFALIKKEDFYNNEENWMPIEMITSGGAE